MRRAWRAISPFAAFVLRPIDGRRQGIAVAGQKTRFPVKLEHFATEWGVIAMSMPSLPQRSWPVGLLLLLAVAGVLYVLMLGNAMYEPSGGGESRMSAAFEGLFLTAGLWIVLAVMIVAGAVGGKMPGWAGGLAGILVPASGIANFTAVDMLSRHMPWAIVFPILLAPLIAFYAFWARMPQLQARLPAERTSVAVWASIFVLSVATFVLAA
jgi:hypothetical protein